MLRCNGGAQASMCSLVGTGGCCAVGWEDRAGGEAAPQGWHAGEHVQLGAGGHWGRGAVLWGGRIGGGRSGNVEPSNLVVVWCQWFLLTDAIGLAMYVDQLMVFAAVAAAAVAPALCCSSLMLLLPQSVAAAAAACC